ncbi:hypothetical protein FACS1894206_08050 [Deltaproteobacteria bacterium]|nr:hypothetical protein FACS1894206_08050 [Deltaproteobacteria bacterium]
MSTSCNCACSTPNRTIEIKVTSSTCPKMPAGSVMVLDGPTLNQEKSKGPVCLTAVNSMYPWIIATRFDVYTPDLEFDSAAGCYHVVCPCGTTNFDIQKGKQA